MANGIIIIDKPADWTSMDVCAKLRGILKTKKVGHAGTLDPMATGVLPVFVGQATRGVSFAESGDKEYLATLRLGLVTNTQDTSGQALHRTEELPDRAALEAVLPRFTGEISQLPPMYSAIKIGGKKLYELARQGKEVERRPRPVTSTPWSWWSRRLPATTFCGCGAPRVPMSAPCATTSGRRWAAAAAWPPCGAPWRRASPCPTP